MRDYNDLYGFGEFWIGDRLGGRMVEIPGVGSWKLDEKISEKAAPPSEEGEAAEATAVYYCHHDGTSHSELAVMKVHMQYM